MSPRARTRDELNLEIADLRLRIAEAQDVLRAIRDYEVDALVVRAERGDQVFALETADNAYRQMVQQMREGAATLAPDGTVLFANHQLALLVDRPALAGHPFEPCVWPADRPRVAALLLEPDGGRIMAHMLGQAGARVPVSLSASPIEIDEHPFVLLLVTDLTHERQADRVARLLQLSRRLAEAVSGQQAAAAIVNGTLQALNANAGFVAVPGPIGLRTLHSVGYTAEQVLQLERQLSEPNQPVSDALSTRSLVAVDSLVQRAERYPHWPMPIIEPAAGALWTVPLQLPDAVVGVLQVCFADERSLEPDEHDFVLAVAQQCAQALERTGLYTEMEARVQARTQELQAANDQLVAANVQLNAEIEERRTVQRQLERSREDERARIARELHDELGSLLTALKMDASRIARTPGLPAEAPQRLAEMMSSLEMAMAAVRRMATELRPHLLADLGLLAALEAYFQDFVKRTGVEGQFIAQVDELDLSDEAATACFRICQEALTNIARHANARQVVLRARPVGEGILIEIADDGQGMRLDGATRPGHLGLVGMRERAAMLPGQLEIMSAPDQGTLVRLIIPNPSASAAP